MNARIMVALLSAVLLCGSASAYAAASGTTSGLVDIDIKNVPVKQAIDTIFDGKGLRYIIEPGVTGRVVELKLKGITVAEALKSLGDAAGFSCRIEDGIYMIGPKATAAGQPVAQAYSTAAQVPMPMPAPPMRRMPPPAPVEAPPVTINNSYAPSGGYGDNAYAYAPAGYGGGYYSPFFTIGPPPYVIGQWPNPPPPPGWVSLDQERLMRFQWAVTRRPSFITPY